MKVIKQFSDLVGRVLTKVEHVNSGADIKDEKGWFRGNEGEAIVFHLEDGRRFMLYHSQDCCESVSVNDIAGDLADLVGEVLFADKSSNAGQTSEWGDSSTWTFYRIGTMRGACVIRWLGSSNGYYSESVDFAEAA